MQVSNIDVGFVTETWAQYGNEPKYQYFKANLDTAGYNILIQSREKWERRRNSSNIQITSAGEETILQWIHILWITDNQCEHLNQIIPLLDHLRNTILYKAANNNANLPGWISRRHLSPTQKLQKYQHIRRFSYSLEHFRASRHHQHARNYGHAWP